MNALRQFFDALNLEESKFIPRIASDNLGLLLRSAVNELDWYHYNIKQTESPSDEQQEQFYLLQIGVARLIQLSLETRASFDVPAVMFRRDRSITIPVLEVVSALAIIEHGRRIAQSVSAGLCKIKSTGENEFLITLPAVIPDEEFYEKAISAHYRSESQRRFAQLFQTKIGQKLDGQVEQKLHELVFPFETHFIGYGADPLLDEYFFGLAYHEVQLYDGFDTFHYSTCFGGIPYQNYIFALTFLISISIRHERFAEVLVKKEPSIRLENILTISSDTEEFLISMRDAINYFAEGFEGFNEITLEEVKCIFEVLSYSRKNKELLARPASALPLIIQNTDQSFIRCLTGARTSPIQFLLDSLRHNFKSDYDKHQQSREKSMQFAIKRVLNDCFTELEYQPNIKIKLNGKVITDIDLVISEKATGTIFLCQLKYQDLYGADLHSKHIRTTRLKEQTENWLVTLDDWLSKETEENIKASLHLRKNFPLLNVYRVVISKHYGYPLKELGQHAQTVCLNWVQFFNSIELVKRDISDARKLSDLINMIKTDEARCVPQSHLDEPQTDWFIGDLKYVVKQE